MADCESLSFAPRAEVGPGSEGGYQPSGLRADLSVEDSGLEDPHGRAQSDVREVQVTLPPGVTVNPSAAEGYGRLHEGRGMKRPP